MGTPLLGRIKSGAGAAGSTPVSTRSQIIESTGSHVASVWGASLPVTVTEVLTLSADGGEVSVKLGDQGWAWLVSGEEIKILT